MTKTKSAILSISFMNILMNAGIIPIYSILAVSLPGATSANLKFTLSISSIFCVIFSLLTGYLVRLIHKKTLLAIGLIIYFAGGVGGGLVNSIEGLLVTRAVLGVGAGICVPLSTAFIADFYQNEERKETIGYSLFAANLSALVLPLIGTWLAEINWRLGFVIYAIALVVLVLSWIYIPARSPSQEQLKQDGKLFNFPGPVIWAAFLYFFVMLLFVSLPNNISIFIRDENLGNATTAALISALSTFVAMIVSFYFAKIHHFANEHMLTFAFLLCGSGFAMMALLNGLWPSILGNILIGFALGMLHPLFPYMAAQAAPPEQCTAALGLVSSGFRMGTFASPFFFIYANSVLGTTTIRGEFSLAASVFGIAMIVSTAVLRGRKPLDNKSNTTI